MYRLNKGITFKKCRTLYYYTYNYCYATSYCTEQKIWAYFKIIIRNTAHSKGCKTAKCCDYCSKRKEFAPLVVRNSFHYKKLGYWIFANYEKSNYCPYCVDDAKFCCNNHNIWQFYSLC